jgi:hypothetical protein
MTRFIVSPLRVGDDIGSGTASKTLLRLPINEMLTDAPEAARMTPPKYPRIACGDISSRISVGQWQSFLPMVQPQLWRASPNW